MDLGNKSVVTNIIERRMVGTRYLPRKVNTKKEKKERKEGREVGGEKGRKSNTMTLRGISTN